MIYWRKSDRWRKTYRSKIRYIGEHQIDEKKLIVQRSLSLFSWLSNLCDVRSPTSWSSNRAPSGPGRLYKTTVDRESCVSAEKLERVSTAIRTNNEIEGWHNALNRCVSGQCGLPLYSMIELLDREARLTAVTIRLVSDKKLKRVQRKQYRNLQARLFDCWEKFERKEKTAAQLLKTYLHLNGPARGNYRRHHNPQPKNGSFRSHQVYQLKKMTSNKLSIKKPDKIWGGNGTNWNVQ